MTFKRQKHSSTTKLLLQKRKEMKQDGRLNHTNTGKSVRQFERKLEKTVDNPKSTKLLKALMTTQEYI